MQGINARRLPLHATNGYPRKKNHKKSNKKKGHEVVATLRKVEILPPISKTLIYQWRRWMEDHFIYRGQVETLTKDWAIAAAALLALTLFPLQYVKVFGDPTASINCSPIHERDLVR